MRLFLAPFGSIGFFDCCRIEGNYHVTAAFLASSAPPPVLADASTTALLAVAAPPPVRTGQPHCNDA